MSTEAVTEAAVADASRRMARTIWRDGLLIGVAGALFGALTALIG